MPPATRTTRPAELRKGSPHWVDARRLCACGAPPARMFLMVNFLISTAIMFVDAVIMFGLAVAAVG